jgi:hypothetical protein
VIGPDFKAGSEKYHKLFLAYLFPTGFFHPFIIVTGKDGEAFLLFQIHKSVDYFKASTFHFNNIL